MKNANNEKNIDKLKQAGLKVTHSRCKILEIFQSFPDEHYTADKLKDQLDDQGENIGLATIYRVLTQLEMADLIQKNNFNDGQSAYEIKKSHHDHLICVDCSRIVEFEDDYIEERQSSIVAEHGFSVVSHKHEVYVRCNDEKCSWRVANAAASV